MLRAATDSSQSSFVIMYVEESLRTLTMLSAGRSSTARTIAIQELVRLRDASFPTIGWTDAMLRVDTDRPRHMEELSELAAFPGYLKFTSKGGGAFKKGEAVQVLLTGLSPLFRSDAKMTSRRASVYDDASETVGDKDSEVDDEYDGDEFEEEESSVGGDSDADGAGEVGDVVKSPSRRQSVQLPVGPLAALRVQLEAFVQTKQQLNDRCVNEMCALLSYRLQSFECVSAAMKALLGVHCSARGIQTLWLPAVTSENRLVAVPLSPNVTPDSAWLVLYDSLVELSPPSTDMHKDVGRGGVGGGVGRPLSLPVHEDGRLVCELMAQLSEPSVLRPDWLWGVQCACSDRERSLMMTVQTRLFSRIDLPGGKQGPGGFMIYKEFRREIEGTLYVLDTEVQVASKQ